MKRYISIDIGGTAIKYGIIGEDAKIMLKKSMPTEAGKGGPAILDKVIGLSLIHIQMCIRDRTMKTVTFILPPQ